LHFDDNSDFDRCKQWWLSVVNITLAFYNRLTSALSSGGLDSKAKANDAMTEVQASVNAVVGSIGSQIEEFKKHIKKA